MALSLFFLYDRSSFVDSFHRVHYWADRVLREKSSALHVSLKRDNNPILAIEELVEAQLVSFRVIIWVTRRFAILFRIPKWHFLTYLVWRYTKKSYLRDIKHLSTFRSTERPCVRNHKSSKDTMVDNVLLLPFKDWSNPFAVSTEKQTMRMWMWYVHGNGTHENF